MIKNNIFALLFHISMILLSTIYLIIITSLEEYLGDILTSPIIKGILVGFWLGIYIKYGSSMKLKHKRKYDFHSGLLILIVGFILWINSNINSTVFNIFMNPIYQVSILLNIEFNQIEGLISIFIPTILIGIGIKYKRIKHGMKKQKAQ